MSAGGSGLKMLSKLAAFATRGLKNHVSPVRFRPSAQSKSLGNSALASATPSVVTMSLGRRQLFRALGAMAASVVLAPLAKFAPQTIPFRLDPRIKPGLIYLLDDKYHFDSPNFYPAWLDADGTILKADDGYADAYGDAYEATFHWLPA